jgi:hypothetical protein
MAGINRAAWLAQRAAAEEREHVIAELDTRPPSIQPAVYNGEINSRFSLS